MCATPAFRAHTLVVKKGEGGQSGEVHVGKSVRIEERANLSSMGVVTWVNAGVLKYRKHSNNFEGWDMDPEKSGGEKPGAWNGHMNQRATVGYQGLNPMGTGSRFLVSRQVREAIQAEWDKVLNPLFSMNQVVWIRWIETVANSSQLNDLSSDRSVELTRVNRESRWESGSEGSETSLSDCCPQVTSARALDVESENFHRSFETQVSIHEGPKSGDCFVTSSGGDCRQKLVGKK
ncbi:hypothetical protein C8F04DRAFT_1192479 [Mycena alexandri]|uniref:Uncharacterized protein n=1 Tax=Mycena alexandri TaxID=1745969 RepID=A0AAD6RZD9_9AGAR|nr:hypothetical protein C8F04DRAFT_1199680 [Mycena alexandri]KAJ7024356.1 hypothetical protein C8F04DRAFT_1192479 [Mycena alexandri]